jgi:hypothetical protein
MKEQDLRHVLSLELGWDEDLISQVVGSIKQHALEESMQGVNEIAQVLALPCSGNPSAPERLPGFFEAS